MKTILPLLCMVCLFACVAPVCMATALPSADQCLQANGLADSHVPVLVWNERAPAQAGVYVLGCRLAPLDGGAPFDVYFDADGRLLSEAALISLGVVGKSWAHRDVSVQSVSASPAKDAYLKTPPPLHIPFAAPPKYVLSPIDHTPLLEEDAWRIAQGGESLARYGVNRALDFPLELSLESRDLGDTAIAADGSWQWQLLVQSQGALGIRLCFETLVLPDDVEVYVYNPDNTSEIFGPIAPGEMVWAPSVVSDVVGVLCRGVSVELLDSVQLRISSLIHVYRSPLSLDKRVGDCHIDVACRPAWAEHASAVGRIGMVDFDAWACTGALIAAPGYEHNPPFFLTANHCISFQARATTIEVWWYFQRDACEDGQIPDLASLPRSTGGAELLTGVNADAGTDFSLLLLNEAPPAPITFLGYTTQPVDEAAQVVCIHHPQGTEKRISFGVLSQSGSPYLGGEPLAPYEFYHEALWQEASTEAGSSGSPLLLAETAQIIGQLYGGYASCLRMEEPDYFGRLDVAFPLIEPWLSGEYPIEEGEQEDEGEGEGEPEGEEPQEGEAQTEGENEEGEGEDRPSGCLGQFVPQPENEPAATIYRYVDAVLRILLPILGMLLARYFYYRDRV